MRREWKKFWRLGSAILAVGAMITAGVATAKAQEAASTRRHNELTLAGLRPGRSKLPESGKILGFRRPSMTDDTGVYWIVGCYGDELHVQEDKDRIVQTVIASLLGPQAGDCSGSDAKLRRGMRSGRGLELGDSCGRVTDLYGVPESRGPSVRGTVKLESLFYSFDWAGEDVPQSMEVSCDSASGRVVEITLASSTL